MLASQRLANIETAPIHTQATAAPGKYLLDKEWEQSRCLQDHGQAEEDVPPVGHIVASKATRWCPSVVRPQTEAFLSQTAIPFRRRFLKQTAYCIPEKKDALLLLEMHPFFSKLATNKLSIHFPRSLLVSTNRRAIGSKTACLSH